MIHCNAICPGCKSRSTPDPGSLSKLIQDSTDVHTATIAAIPNNEDLKAGLGSLHPLRGLGTPEDVAGPAVFLASEDARWVTGVALPVDGGFTAQ